MGQIKQGVQVDASVHKLLEGSLLLESRSLGEFFLILFKSSVRSGSTLISKALSLPSPIPGGAGWRRREDNEGTYHGDDELR